MNHKKLLLTLTLCLCALLCTVVTASASEVQEHSHPVCGKTHTDIDDHTEDKCSTPTWTKLYMDGDGKLCYGEGQQVTYDSAFDYYRLPAGTYYLGTDLTLNRGIQIDSNGGDVTLCLNGKMISCGTGAAIQVKGVNNKNITFTLCDCEGSGVITHTGNDENDKGGNGVDVANSNNGGNNEVAKFIMYNGHITKNKGSGVYLNDSTSFTMYGGRITQNGYNNTSLFGGYGGGVYVASEASFTMYGGNITGNYANKNGGGVHVGSETANFTMYGGSITGNASKGDGGGIYFYSGTFAMYGGSVTGNSCNSSKNGGGVYISTDTTITLSGNVQIKDNYKGSNSNKKPSNIYLAGNKTITADGSLTGSSIGVTTATEPGTGSNVTFANGNANTITTGIFTPDTAGVLVGVAADGTSAYLYKCSHVYEWAYDEEYHWKKCTNVGCDSVEAGSKKAHTWDYPADYNNPKTCVCGATQGEPLTRSYYYYTPSAAEDKKDSPKTADPGVLLYAGLALASLTGLACTAKKRH